MKKALSVAVLGLFLPIAAMAADPLGRLFFTPAQRATLDAGNKVKDTNGQAAPVRQGPPTVILNGIVVRSDGESTIWVNGKSSGPGSRGNISATPSAESSSARIKVPGSASTKMRVGQELDTRTGIVREGFARRRNTAATTGSRPDPSGTGTLDKIAPDGQTTQVPDARGRAAQP